MPKYCINSICICLLVIFFVVFVPNRACAWPADFNQPISVLSIAIIGFSIFVLIYYYIQTTKDLDKVEGWIDSRHLGDYNMNKDNQPNIVDRLNIYSSSEAGQIIAIANKNDAFLIYDIVSNTNGKWYKIKFPKKYLLAQ
ncbi:hypothetical protein HZC35_02905 [Candidatus Saganbacteria bacterium]|nr:hypothetical protein [Candidatus Saganbacteria bacterium]